MGASTLTVVQGFILVLLAGRTVVFLQRALWPFEDYAYLVQKDLDRLRTAHAAGRDYARRWGSFLVALFYLAAFVLIIKGMLHG